MKLGDVEFGFGRRLISKLLSKVRNNNTYSNNADFLFTSSILIRDGASNHYALTRACSFRVID